MGHGFTLSYNQSGEDVEAMKAMMKYAFDNLDIVAINAHNAMEWKEHLYFTNDKLPQDILMQDGQVYETPILKEAARQLGSYLAGKLEEFSLPLEPDGTAFMKQVWAGLCEIPYGRTASYKDIAAKIGSPNAARAVGLANNRNPIPIIIPCHRIIGADGSLTGYRGGIGLKKRLLDLENSFFHILP